MTASRLVMVLILCVGHLLLGKTPLAAEPAEIKAAFIKNFAKFTRWPSKPEDTRVICFPSVVERVGAIMEQRHASDDETLRVIRGLELHQLSQCDIVYLSSKERYRVTEILAELSDLPVLTIADLADFNAVDGMIELFPDGNKYRFSVNLHALKHSGLEINARILALARERRAQ